MIGRDFDEAIALVTALGPAGEVLRLAGERAAIRPQVEAALRENMAEFARTASYRAGLDLDRQRASGLV